MRDWSSVVREKIGAEVVPGSRDEVMAELASHLEDFYEELRAHGACESEAIERALGEIGDSRHLAHEIRRIKGGGRSMNARTKQLWLPGLASLTAGNLVLMALTSISLGPRVVVERSAAWFPGLALMTAYLPWMAAQPLVGALGAWLSHRAGGGRTVRLCAGLFPSIVMLACWGILIPATAAIEHAWVMRHPIHLVLGALAWVAPATLGLLLGSLPFLGVANFKNLDAVETLRS